MKPYDRFLANCRSPRGQIQLIAVIFISAMVAACAVLGVRTRFERTVYERFPLQRQQPNADALRELATDVDVGRVGVDGIEDVTATELIVVYGVLIDDETVAADGPLAQALWNLHGGEMISRVRRTLVAGSRRQRLRALAILETIPDKGHLSEAMSLCRYVIERASRCGDDDLAATARSVLADLRGR